MELMTKKEVFTPESIATMFKLDNIGLNLPEGSYTLKVIDSEELFTRGNPIKSNKELVNGKQAIGIRGVVTSEDGTTTKDFTVSSGVTCTNKYILATVEPNQELTFEAINGASGYPYASFDDSHIDAKTRAEIDAKLSQLSPKTAEPKPAEGGGKLPF